MKKFLFLFLVVFSLVLSSGGYAVGTFDDLHRIRLNSEGNEIASYMDITSDGRIFEIYSDGIVEERGEGIGQLFAFTSSNLDWLKSKCISEGGGLIYQTGPSGYSTSKCLALTESDKLVCIGKGYTIPKTCGDGSLGTGYESKTSICSQPYTSQSNCEQCFNDYKCTGTGLQRRSKIRYSNGQCSYDNIIDTCPSGTTCTLYYKDELPICAGDCIDSDGFDLTIKGKVDYFGETITDSCDGDKVDEYTCGSKDGPIEKTPSSCGSDSKCESGRCVKQDTKEEGNGTGGGELTTSCIREGNICELTETSTLGFPNDDSKILNECETGYCADIGGARNRCEIPICCEQTPNNFVATIGTLGCNGKIVDLSECSSYNKNGITQDKINKAKNDCGGITNFPEKIIEEEIKLAEEGDKPSLTMEQLEDATKTKIKDSACKTDSECSKRTGFTTSCSASTDVVLIVEEKFDSLFNKIFGAGIEGICLAEPKDDGTGLGGDLGKTGQQLADFYGIENTALALGITIILAILAMVIIGKILTPSK